MTSEVLIGQLFFLLVVSFIIGFCWLLFSRSNVIDSDMIG